jgi:hypothetical protein
MKVSVLLLWVCALVLVAGCGGRSNRNAPSWNITPGHSPAPQPTASTVFVQGPVRFQKILWSPGMTLSRAIVTAQYIDRRNPRAIYITRNGERYPIDPNALLRGDQDPAIEPGDLIELQL